MTAEDGVELRIVVPRSAIPAASGGPAECFSQRNCLERLGLPPRVFLELLRRKDAPAVTKIGKLRLVEREPMLAFLRTLREHQEAAADELDGADRLLAELGCLPQGRRRSSGVR